MKEGQENGLKPQVSDSNQLKAKPGKNINCLY
jgi:hypothetical protein